MKETRRDLAVSETGGEVDAIFFQGQGVRLLKGVQRSQTVAGTSAAPVLRNGQDHGKVSACFLGSGGGGGGGVRANAGGETIHPVRGLVIVRGTDNRHVVHIVSGMHGLDGGIQSGSSVSISHGR